MPLTPLRMGGLLPIDPQTILSSYLVRLCASPPQGCAGAETLFRPSLWRPFDRGKGRNLYLRGTLRLPARALAPLHFPFSSAHQPAKAVPVLLHPPPVQRSAQRQYDSAWMPPMSEAGESLCVPEPRCRGCTIRVLYSRPGPVSNGRSGPTAPLFVEITYSCAVIRRTPATLSSAYLLTAYARRHLEASSLKRPPCSARVRARA